MIKIAIIITILASTPTDYNILFALSVCRGYAVWSVRGESMYMNELNLCNESVDPVHMIWSV